MTSTLTIFTTRPDTSFGMTYAVLAPEHPLVEALVTDPEERREVARFRQEVARESEIERLAADRPKRGLRLRARAINPFNGKEIPLFLADYVLMGYGTGAIMAVPGEDQRDWDFAVQYGLPIVPTVQRPADWQETQAYTGDGVKINSGFLDGLGVADAVRKAIDWLVAKGIGRAKINYRLRDWGISRQRYWGAPIPIVYCAVCGMVPEREDRLPVVLPEDVQISGKGGSPLAEVPSFVHTRCPRCGGPRAARHRHDGHLRRVVLVFPPLLLAGIRAGHVRPRGGGVLDARRPVHRRHRARRAPSPVRALLHQGAARPRHDHGRTSPSPRSCRRAWSSRTARRCRSRRATWSTRTS